MSIAVSRMRVLLRSTNHILAIRNSCLRINSWAVKDSKAWLRKCSTLPSDSAQDDSIQQEQRPKPASAPSCTDRQVGVNRKMQKKVVKAEVKQPANARIAKVAIIGAPNAGKSTLLNKLLKWKVSSVSRKVHTTRQRTVGVLSDNNRQIVFLDTPGMVTPEKRRKHDLEFSLLTDPHSCLFEADVIVVVVDASCVWERHQLPPEILKVLHLHRKKSVLVLNKCDINKHKAELLHSVRILTEGVLASRRDWYKPVREDGKKKKKSFYLDLFDRVDKLRLEEGAEGEDSPEKCKGAGLVSGDGKPSSDHDRTADNGRENGDDVTDFSECVLGHVDSVEALSDKYKVGWTAHPFRVHTFDGTKKLTENTPLWHEYYYCDLKRIGKTIEDKKGYAGFERSFSVSALTGMGVDDLKEYLFECTKPGPWLYNDDVVTDNDPIEMAEMCLREVLLNHMDKSNPYITKVKATVWEVEDGLLKLEFDVECPSSREKHFLLSGQPLLVSTVAYEAKGELMNIFRTEIVVRVRLRVKGEKSDMSTSQWERKPKRIHGKSGT